MGLSDYDSSELDYKIRMQSSEWDADFDEPDVKNASNGRFGNISLVGHGDVTNGSCGAFKSW